MKVPTVKGTLSAHKNPGEYYEMTDSENGSYCNENDEQGNGEKWPTYMEQILQGLNTASEGLTEHE